VGLERHRDRARLPAPARAAAYSSKSLQSPWRRVRTWRSPPPSTGASSGVGYGPGSDSSATSKLTGTSGCVNGTLTNGMPYAPSPPKSGHGGIAPSEPM
jgi:hypothetical protein